MSYLIRLALFTLAVISILSFFSKPTQEQYSKNLGHPWEEYDPSYFNRFQTVQSIISHSDSSIGFNQRNTLAYYNFTAATVRKRFYHGYSYYNFSDNPLSYLAGRCIWDDLSAIVIPDDIMKHPMAACSQQAMVMMEVFRRNNIPYRKVNFKGHYAIEGFIEKKWRFFDPDMEPKLKPARESLTDLVAENKLDLAYTNTGYSIDHLRNVLKGPKQGTVNEEPAPHATLFHKTCLLLVSKWFLLSVFALSFLITIRSTLVKRMFAGKNVAEYSATELTF